MSTLSDIVQTAEDCTDRLVGKVLDGKYLVAECLGRGGFGAVYRATSLAIGNDVALKIINFGHAPDAKRAKRFISEAAALAALSHPNIVQIKSTGVDQDHQPYMAMELVRGKTLEQLVGESGALSEEQFVAIFTQVCDALSHAHERGFVHRDIKPGNLMVDEGGIVKILDFGIAKLAGVDQRLTGTGEIVGSPQCMSPEQCSSQPVDERSDIYSLGCAMYFACSARPVFAADSLLELLYKHLNESPELQHVPERFRGLVATCLEKQQGMRFQTMDQVRAALLEGWNVAPSSSPVQGKARPRAGVLIACVIPFATLIGLGIAWGALKPPAAGMAGAPEQIFRQVKKRLDSHAVTDEDAKLIEEAVGQVARGGSSQEVERQVLWGGVWVNNALGRAERKLHYLGEVCKFHRRYGRPEYGVVQEYADGLTNTGWREQAAEVLGENMKWFLDCGLESPARRLKYELLHLCKVMGDTRKLKDMQLELSAEPCEEADLKVLNDAMASEQNGYDIGGTTAMYFLEAPHSSRYPGSAAMANNILASREFRQWKLKEAKHYADIACELAKQGIDGVGVSAKQKEICREELGVGQEMLERGLGKPRR